MLGPEQPAPAFKRDFYNTLEMFMNVILRYALLVAVCICASPRGFAQSTQATPDASQPKHVFTKDMTVYVRDFDLDAQNVKVDKGAGGRIRPGLIERPSKREQTDPEAQANKLVDTMSKSLVDDLHKAGYKAQRLGHDDPMPSTGALVTGVFTEVDEGNRMHRALIGFGSGSTKMDLYVTMSDLASPEKPLYNLAQEDTSGKKPGAAITLNPYVAAVKFAMEKNAPEKTVKKTASEISAQVVKHLKEHELPATASRLTSGLGGDVPAGRQGFGGSRIAE
jgi:Domain of unknown function (DUF4410)